MPAVRQSATELPCIRCGDCVSACPQGLQPQHLLQLLDAEQWSVSAANGLFDCTGCGACDAVCPSAIGITRVLTQGQATLRTQQQQRAFADAARTRFEARTKRLLREQHALAERKAVQQRQATGVAAVAAALERARAKRQRPASDP